MEEQMFDEEDRVRLAPKLVSREREPLPETLAVAHPNVPSLEELLTRASRNDLSLF